MNDEPTGLFAHGPEPTAANLVDLCRRVKQEKADLGFAQDPDADRLAIVDENGVYIGEEYTLALAAKYIFSTQRGNGRRQSVHVADDRRRCRTGGRRGSFARRSARPTWPAP